MTEETNLNENANVETTETSEQVATPEVQIDPNATELLKLQSELSKLQEQLTDPEFMEYRATKNAPKQNESLELPDFEAMDNKQVVKTVVGMTEQRINKIATELQRKIDMLATGISNFVAKSSVEGLQQKYKDFGALQNDVMQVLREHPSYDLEDAYILAKHKSSQRIVATKPNIRAATQKELPKEGVSSTVANKEYKTTQEAAEGAWEKLLGDKTSLEG